MFLIWARSFREPSFTKQPWPLRQIAITCMHVIALRTLQNWKGNFLLICHVMIIFRQKRFNSPRRRSSWKFNFITLKVFHLLTRLDSFYWIAIQQNYCELYTANQGIHVYVQLKFDSSDLTVNKHCKYSLITYCWNTSSCDNIDELAKPTHKCSETVANFHNAMVSFVWLCAENNIFCDTIPTAWGKRTLRWVKIVEARAAVC